VTKFVLVIGILLAFTQPTSPPTSPTVFSAGGQRITAPATDSLVDTIAALDSAVFDAFNRCSSPEQLQKHASFFAPDVEFYHDKGGVTWTREAMIANTRRNVCGNFRRELVAGTLRVYPIKDFGAIEQGSHKFCQFATGKCDGLAEFVIVWRYRNASWQITRVLSYAHRPNE
jgi:uncharacterized protein DUF4440